MWPKDFDLTLYSHKMSKACPTHTGRLLVRENCLQNVTDSSFAKKWPVLFPSTLGHKRGRGGGGRVRGGDIVCHSAELLCSELPKLF